MSERQLNLTAQDVAGMLRVAKNTVYELVKRGELNYYKVGRKIRFTSSDVDSYVADSRRVRKADSSVETFSAIRSPQTVEAGFIISGQDAMLDVLTGLLSRRPDVDRHALRAYVGSYEGLTALYRSEVHAATAHLWDGDSGQ
jgi:putative molybdopterin biosynthesis protein